MYIKWGKKKRKEEIDMKKIKKETKKYMEEERMVNKFEGYNVAVELLEGVILAGIGIFILFMIVELFTNNFDLNLVKANVLEFLEYDGSSSELRFLFECVVKFTSLIIILECLRRMMSDTYKQKTPFLKQNINRMRIIAVSSVFYSTQTAHYVIVLMAIVELFKYGYKLQQESDETL